MTSRIPSFLLSLNQRTSVGVKVVLLVAIVSIIGVVVVGWRTHQTQASHIHEDLHENALLVARAIEAATVANTSGQTEQDLFRQLVVQQYHIEMLAEREPSVELVNVFALGERQLLIVGSSDREALGGPAQPEDREPVEAALAGGTISGEREVRGVNTYELVVPLTIQGQPPLAIGVYLSTGERDAALAASQRTFMTTAGVSVAGALAVTYAVVWLSVSKRLQRLTHAAAKMREGDYSTRVRGQASPTANDEIVRLTAHFNSMAESIEKLHKDTTLLASTDPLTGLNNRRLFLDELQRAVERSRRSGEPLAVIMLDLDGFKAVNDRYGHAVGDAALTHIAQALTSAARAGDFTARFGGDEFVVLLPNCDGESLATTMERIRRQIDELAPPHAGDGEAVNTTASAGGALLRDEDTVDSLMQRADLALFEAKDRGRNQVRVAA